MFDKNDCEETIMPAEIKKILSSPPHRIEKADQLQVIKVPCINESTGTVP